MKTGQLPAYKRWSNKYSYTLYTNSNSLASCS